jgi:hypothetical protein
LEGFPRQPGDNYILPHSLLTNPVKHMMQIIAFIFLSPSHQGDNNGYEKDKEKIHIGKEIKYPFVKAPYRFS